MKQVIATFYKFVNLPDYQELKEIILPQCYQHQIKGTILLASEGINATIAAEASNLEQLLNFLASDPRFANLNIKKSYSDKPPFQRMKVKLKKEIVTLGKPEANPREKVGTYINPQEWNQLINDPQVVLIDTRNEYEVEIGTFKGAINPKTQSFREFPDYVRQNLDPKRHKKVAMFCTGGIRCEKATSYLLNQGFEQVYHLHGGILKYLEDIPPQESLWQGECFVFDERVAVNHNLDKGEYDMCLGCGHPISETDKHSPQYQEGISCPHCFPTLTPEKQARLQEKQKQKLLLQS